MQISKSKIESLLVSTPFSPLFVNADGFYQPIEFTNPLYTNRADLSITYTRNEHNIY